MTEVRLKVEEARRTDVGRQIARISTEVADELGVKTGDVIEIVGQRSTYAKVWRSASPEVNSEIIRIEHLIRQNARVSLDGYVTIRPAKVTMAKTVFITPVETVSISMNLTPYLARALVDKVVTKGDLVPISTGFGGVIYLAVVKTEPGNAVIFGTNSELKIVDQSGTETTTGDVETKEKIAKISYEDIGGLSDAIRKVREMIELPLRHPEIFERLGIQPPKGVLLYGPPGTGKTLLAKAIASETNSHFISIGGPEIMSKFYGESEGKLREIFEEANENAPSIIFIDEIDSIAPKREEVTGEVERRIVAQLLSLMDGLEARGDVVVIAATNRPDSIDPALRRGGRFDRELEIGIPDEMARLEIMQIHTRGMPLDATVNLNELASRTHGFVGADLQILAKEAALSSMRRFLPEIDLSPESKSLDPETLQKLNITMADFEHGLIEVNPSALREVFVEIPDVKWEDVGGLDDVKDLLKETIEWPMLYKTVFETMKAKPPRGVLLYGPPGTGKTMLAKA
ncbi:MAG: AAA family ATPase, partial [Candidatus Kariarchaeaceae archaeon]